MKIGFDIGGVISKYPEQLRRLIRTLLIESEIFVITDQHNKEDVYKVLLDNAFGFISPKNVYCCDYETHGNMAKAVLIKQLELDIFIDDFDGYLQWDSSLGPQPILLKVMPDAYKPYWHETWECEGSEFGRRKASFPQS